MKRIIQRHIGDCAIASLAMYLGKTYDEIVHHYDKEEFYEGVNNNKTFAIAKQYGVNLLSYTLENVPKGMLIDGKALIVLPSLTIEGEHHMIYYDGKKVYDPARGTKLYIEIPKSIHYAFAEDGAILTYE